MKVRHIPIYILVAINVAVVLGLWATGFCSWLSPNTYGWLSIMGYAFPFFILATIAFLLVWVVTKKRFLLISIVGLLVAYQPVTLYCPLNSTTAAADMPDSLITVLSYNSSNWGNLTTSPDKVSTPEEKVNMIAEMVKQTGADILVMQESPLNDHTKSITSMYQYADTLNSKEEKGIVITLISRYPIIRKENLNIESKGNACGAFWIDVNGKEVIVINTHLEVMHFSMAERSQLSTIVHGNQKDRDSIRTTSHTLIGKIYNSTKIRARQAERIAEFIKQHADTPIILAGDFNDIPNSYVHHTIADALTDCYATTAFGPGYTFKHFGIRVRIDNIMCSPHFTPYNCHVVKDITVSDHQPVTVKLKFLAP
ncbi:MAG: endonuclease/exonuclease/phosphatase family protein [Prevotella sp.]|nr:endonuclease/exonuclease/phosphatase family protein [Prevotella sp.]